MSKYSTEVRNKNKVKNALIKKKKKPDDTRHELKKNKPQFKMGNDKTYINTFCKEAELQTTENNLYLSR